MKKYFEGLLEKLSEDHQLFSDFCREARYCDNEYFAAKTHDDYGIFLIDSVQKLQKLKMTHKGSLRKSGYTRIIDDMIIFYSGIYADLEQDQESGILPSRLVFD